MKVTKLFTEKDRDMFDRIDRDCLAMHVCPPPKTFLKLEVVDANGKPLETYEDRAHSWVRNAYNILASQFLLTSPFSIAANYGAGSLQCRDIAGTSMSKGASPLNLSGFRNWNADMGFIVASAGINGGIVIGTGTTAESFENNKLVTQILSGNSATRMAYNAVTDANLTRSYDAGTKKMTIVAPRVFNNNSGASIVVSEVGIYASANNVGNIMICRDLLASAVTVPNAGQLTVTYTIEMTFPE